MRRMTNATDSATAEKCILCDTPLSLTWTSRDYISGEEFTVYSCVSCGLGVALPRVPAHELSRYYAENYYKKRKSGADAYINRKRLQRVARMQVGPVRGQPNTATQHKVDASNGAGKKILDVGCGNGAFV